MTAASLDIADVSKRYPGVLALDRVSFACMSGEVHAVLGENGSGKSTLLKIASGAVAADEGAVTIMGRPLASADPALARRLGLAIVYQDDSLVRELSVADNLALGIPGAPARGRRAWAARLLDDYAVRLPPAALVGRLTSGERQFLEIVKALATTPKVLLLDEPTASLDQSGVEMLGGVIRRIAADGTAVVYVSHRLPEIIALADRVTILRDGVMRGTYPVDAEISESDLIALMVGRPIETEYPPRGTPVAPAVVLSVRDLCGSRFRDLSFDLHRGEILGFAGAEGNGQREAIRALGGLEPTSGGTILRNGARLHLAGPRDAMAAGVVTVSSDRAVESIYPPLGVRENMTVQVLDRFVRGGFVSTAGETAAAAAMVDELAIVASSLDQPISGLSGGNQQKAVMARVFLRGADVVLIDEPTQGVDAGARVDIYHAIRAKADAGTACVLNASDALELAGMCDRVLVFSRGRVIRQIPRGELSEESIVGSFLRARQAAGGDTAAVRGLAALAGGAARMGLALLVVLALILAAAVYAAQRTPVFLSDLNIRHILLAAAPLALVTAAQLNVLLVRGFDMSVGSLMSVIVVIASFLIADEAGPGAITAGVLACLALGAVAGGTNAALVRRIGINPVIATISTLSVLQGVALWLRPSPDGVISDDFLQVFRARLGGIPISAFVILGAAVLGDVWLHGTAGGLATRAVGFREEAAARNGVPVARVQMRAYLLSGLLATVGGFFLASEVGVGDPVIGAGYTLTSIAAAVIGGAALTGGRGGFVGAVLGALFFSVTTNIIALLNLNTGAGIIASGALTLFAVFLYAGWKPLLPLGRRLRRAVDAALFPARAA